MILTKSGLEGLKKKIPNDGFKKSWLEVYFSLCDPSHTPVGILLWVTGQYFTMLQLNFFFKKKANIKFICYTVHLIFEMVSFIAMVRNTF